VALILRSQHCGGAISDDVGVSKKPANPLPPDRNRRRGVRYVGMYVVWWDDGNWEWIKCVNCGSDLTSQSSREHGCGPTCALVVTEAMKEARLRDERILAEAYLAEKARGGSTPRASSRRSRSVPRARGIGQPKNRQPPSKLRGITNEQAKELARLQRAAGESYTGHGMSEAQAAAEIRRLISVAAADATARPGTGVLARPKR
jgi:hypothetical protein